MRAAIWPARGERLVVDDVQLRDLAPNEVLLRNHAASITQSENIDMRPQGPIAEALPPLEYPQIVGHGTSSTVEAVGSSVTLVKPGDHVVATASPQCHTCYFCRRGRTDQCVVIGDRQFLPHGRLSDGREVSAQANLGAFAEMSITTDIQIAPVQTDVPHEQLAVLSIMLSAGLGGALISAPIEEGSTVAVFGCGMQGLSYILGAKVANAARIIAVDPLEHRRAKALEIGATDVVDPTAGDVVETIRSMTPDDGGFQGRGAHFTYEASADPSAIPQAYDVTHAGGHLVLAAVPFHVGSHVSMHAANMAMCGICIHGSQHGDIHLLRDIPKFVGLIEDGKVDAGALVTDLYELDEVDRALLEIERHEALGAVLTFR